MKRIRFHGRGGQGMKTASRIVGTASFLEGYIAQDCPVYGAERRGAPIQAYTRVSKNPILERGVIVHPDITIIADETLLDDHTANVFQGVYEGTITMINTHYPSAHVRERYGISGKIVTLDITDIVLTQIGKPVLSSVAAASACKLTGMVTKQSLKEAVAKELFSVDLPQEVVEKNVEAALICFERTPDIHIDHSEPIKDDNTFVKLEYSGPYLGTPSTYASGNTVLKKTGNWRLFKPVIDYERCSRCRACFIHCPHSCISLDTSGYPQINYENCKGCLICFCECPKKAITKEKEVREW
ncbi:MAG: 2-oxoacid:acceptor oxidoreductase family protein [Candidatus Scalindua sp.]|nr:2-oxoacid:acceptor oxidoreductase family protein [Candidatus Scalindua sp.]